MRITAVCLALALVLPPTLARGAGFAEGTPVRVTGIDADSALNLRQGPGTANPVLATLSPGQTGLTVLYCDAAGRWCRVSTMSGDGGWVAASYLERDDKRAAEPTAPSAPAWHSVFPPESSYSVTGISPGSVLNVRAGPGTANPVVRTLSAGQAGLGVRDCTETADWCRIDAGNGPLGWVASRYLANMAEARVEITAERRQGEATRLAAAIGRTVDPEGMTTLPELPPYLIGAWDADRDACARADSDTRIVIEKNGLTVGAATARFKTAIFRGGGYDLTTLLILEEDVINAVPQRALYRLQPDDEALVLSGDVLAERRLEKCGG